jgi:competence protein ComEC
MQSTKPKLFLTPQSFLVTLTLLGLLLGLRLGILYYDYVRFIQKPFYFTTALVEQAYEKQKNGKSYTVLKLHSQEGYRFYTTTHEKRDFNNCSVRVQLFPNETITFSDYLGTFYVNVKLKDVYPSKEQGIRERLKHAIAAQHKSVLLGSFYSAIFLATPLPKPLREEVNLLGVSHLIALSGFHLGILWALVYGVLALIYGWFQQHFFPYRYTLVDVGSVALVLLGVYVWFVGAPPSLLRAYVMVMLGWLALVFGVELLSFRFLAFVIALLLVLFPSLSVSIGFWFSVAGVYYIYLLLYYFKGVSNWVVTLLLIPIGLFVLMLPVIHGVFEVVSLYQLTSIVLSLLFVLFYPVTLVLHLVGYGDLFDGALLWILELPKVAGSHLLSSELMWAYVGLSLVAMASKRWFYLLVLISSLYTIYLYGVVC